MSQFGQLGLQYRLVPRIVHQAKVVGKFRVETDDEKIFLERNRVRLQEISADKGAGAPDRFDEVCPKRIQFGGGRGGRGGLSGFLNGFPWCGASSGWLRRRGR